MTPYYQDSAVTIYHGDCREILPQLSKVELVIVSPPYNLCKKWWDCGSNGMHIAMARKFNEEWYPDELPESDYQQEQKSLVSVAISKSTGPVCYNHKVRYAYKRMGTFFHPMQWLSEFPLWVEIIWNKGGGPAQNCRRPIVSDERIFVLGRPATWNDMGYTTVWDIPPDRECNDHPCTFPVEIPHRLIGMFSNPSETVLDYNCGSGTTLRAAKDLGRKSIGIEIDEKYAEIAARRMAQEVLSL